MDIPLKSGRVPRLEKLAPVLLAALVVLVYSNSFMGTLLFDDVRTIERIASGTEQSMRRPVVDLTFSFNWKIGGTKAADYHAVNLAIHVMSALLLFGIVRWTVILLSGANMSKETGAAVAFLVAAAWAVHPLTTSAVTYVSQRYELMMAMFYLLTLYAAIRGLAGEGISRQVWSVLAVAACGAGMASKEVMITAPVSVMLYDWVFCRGTPLRRLWARRWALYAGLAGCWAVLWVVMRRGGSQKAPEFAYVGVTPWQYAATELGVVCRYLRLALWPVGLCFDYGWAIVTDFSHAWFPGLTIILLLALVAFGLARRRAWSFPLALFFLILAPTSTIVPRPDPIMEYRAYLALAGVVALVVIVLHRAIGGHPQAVRIGRALACFVVLGLSALTYQRNHDYRSDVCLWRTTVTARPHNVRARVGLGAALLRAGDVKGAKDCFRRTLSDISGGKAGNHAYLKTVQATAHNNLGAILSKEGDLDGAAAQFEAALRVAPDYRQARDNLVRVRSAAGVRQ